MASPESLWGLAPLWLFPISFACGSLNINMHKNPLPSLLLSDGLLGVWWMGVHSSLYTCSRPGVCWEAWLCLLYLA